MMLQKQELESTLKLEISHPLNSLLKGVYLIKQAKTLDMMYN